MTIPTDLSDYKEKYGKNITDKQRKGLLKFFKYLETIKLRTDWNGYPLELFRNNLSISEHGASRMGSRIKDLSVSEVRAARDRIENAGVQIYCTLLAYSGARHSHLFEALKKKRPVKHYGNGVIGIDVKDLSSGTKNESVFYFPVELQDALMSYKHPFGSDRMLKVIGASGTEKRPINAASLRKWQYNEMLTGAPRIEDSAADHIQGRAPKTVGAKHYADLDKIAAEGYAVILPKLRKALPVPDWMTEFEQPPEENKEKRKPPVRKLSDKKKEEIIKLSKEGNSQREISKISGCARQTVSNVLKDIKK